MVNIAVLGHGTVGSGVCELLHKNVESITKKTGGTEIFVKRVLDLRDFSGTGYDEKFTKDFNDILNDEEIKIVVEVMGGVHPAFDFCMSAMEKGKCVVTSNKELVAMKGAELLKTADENNVSFMFEASVGGGIPILRPLHQCLAANELSEIAGILNGTSNFILTKMIKEGMSFEDALKIAQDLGYAERNPAADVEGHDACRKICILASLAFGKHIYPDSVSTEGITNITLTDVKYAEAIGSAIKLIARTKMLENGKIFIRTSPAILSRGGQLANVDDVFNGILVRGDAVGDAVFYGKGAGKMPTASAVVADVIDETKHIGRVPKRFYWEEAEEGFVEDCKLCGEKQFIRCEFNLKADGEKLVSELFGEVKYIFLEGRSANELAFITDEITYGDLELAKEKLSAISGGNLSVIPVLDY